MNKEELKLIEEMKENCIKQANYVDVKAMDKYNALRNLLEGHEKLQQRIDKAIEYIEENINFCENDSQGAYNICNIRIASDKKLLEILKGEDTNG